MTKLSSGFEVKQYTLPTGPLPWVVEAVNRNATLEEALAWTEAFKEEASERLAKHGAILFRGFPLTGGADFERIAKVFSPNLMDYIEGGLASRRVATGKVMTSTDAPPWYNMGLHQELNYTDAYPLRIMFYCPQPAAEGGATPLVDMRAVTNDIPERIKKQFRDRKLRLRRRLERKGKGRFEGWPDVFKTSDEKKVDEIAKEKGWAANWRGNGRLDLDYEVRSPMVEHRKTKETVWFNSAQDLNPQAFLSRLLAVKDYRRWLTYRLGLKSIPLGRLMVHADGGAIDAEDLATIRDIIGRHVVEFAWQRHDFTLVDNLLVSHGRRPYKGKRSVLVALLED